MTISIKEACSILGVSRATLYRRMHTGELKCSKTAPDGVGHQSVTFTPEQLGMTQARVTAVLSGHDVPINAYYEGTSATDLRPAPCVQEDARVEESFQPRPLSPIEQKQLEDLEFAKEYKAGRATDSHGNKFGSITVEPRQRQRVSGTSHMNPALVGGIDRPRVPKPWDTDYQERWIPGAKAATEKMYGDAGLRQPTEQERKQVMDAAAIRASFRQGYSR